jgi:protein-S-isoprenylcysteine O-methyltransferase Ste14
MKANFSKTSLAFVGTLIYLFLLVPFFIIWIPYEILSASGHDIEFNSGVFQHVGLVFIALGVVAYIWCSGSFVFYAKGTPIPFTPTKELVVTGLYKYVRNPLYIAGMLVLLGETLLFLSKGIFIYTLIMFGVFNIHVLMEENHLEDTFGKKYEQYRKDVPRWIPRFKSYKENDPSSQ